MCGRRIASSICWTVGRRAMTGEPSAAPTARPKFNERRLHRVRERREVEVAHLDRGHDDRVARLGSGALESGVDQAPVANLIEALDPSSAGAIIVGEPVSTSVPFSLLFAL